MIKNTSKEFEQYLSRNKSGERKEQSDFLLSLIGDVVVFFNGLEAQLDSCLCEVFTDRTDATGLIVLNKMAYSSKVDLLKRFGDDLHSSIDKVPDIYNELIRNLRESGRIRNIVVHADWENQDEENYTFTKVKITKFGMVQEYSLVDEDSLIKIVEFIVKTRKNLAEYWEERRKIIYH